jgi:hypothetical protein
MHLAEQYQLEFIVLEVSQPGVIDCRQKSQTPFGCGSRLKLLIGKAAHRCAWHHPYLTMATGE